MDRREVIPEITNRGNIYAGDVLVAMLNDGTAKRVIEFPGAIVVFEDPEVERPCGLRCCDPLSGSCKQLPTQALSFPVVVDMKVIETCTPLRFLIQQNTHKTLKEITRNGQKNELSLRL